ncbi:hypothetical protein OVY01_05995 [Robbsia sp. Bb-Pol-6]|uniref:Uncharacterized protein n=1 Tax=Robbsia betulipollinis TaxID=2981849 RepID=A0ABT3ZKC3_9BURK|nr:hypothetical protein [Robbsia betulipollinis]MCY0386792.1 hypothetical protein [Robbsia betulipollinis]
MPPPMPFVPVDMPVEPLFILVDVPAAPVPPVEPVPEDMLPPIVLPVLPLLPAPPVLWANTALDTPSAQTEKNNVETIRLQDMVKLLSVV